MKPSLHAAFPVDSQRPADLNARPFALPQAPNMECTMFERKMDNCKPCGGAIPLCMVEEFALPPEIVDRRVRKMKMNS